ncbi:MAG: hypothetical protein EZS28_047421 [Streblomastix strix]|uniref:Uncharacterized protein n=1 Tax=Streblomastix strix TaxID=222440 RepID=A0A5J4TGN0_9EUKA|nr:MAG: hypothetical protein EZS28_047421 [Streblomastix strix]
MRNHMKKCQINVDPLVKKLLLKILRNETLEKKVNETFGDSSQVTAILIPYDVAQTVKSASGIDSFYYDIRTEDFMDKRQEQLFEEYKQIKKDTKQKRRNKSKVKILDNLEVFWLNINSKTDGGYAQVT